jgi:hypothetical protein
MKLLIKLFLVMIFVAPVAPVVYAETINLLVLPDEAFPTVSGIAAGDVADCFNKTAKIHAYISPVKYKSSGKLDFTAYKRLAVPNDYVLVISSYVVTGENKIKRDLREVMQLAQAFGIQYPFELETSVLLIDSPNDLVMWSKTYRKNLTNNHDKFTPEEIENIKMYSKDILSQDIVQNITLRFFPKSIRPIDVSPQTAPVLRYDTTPAIKPSISPENYGEIIFGM